MSCNHCSTVSSTSAAAAGAPDIEASWSANRGHPQYCPTCHAFLRADGGCSRCERMGVTSDAETLTASPAPVLSTQRYNPPFTDDEMRAKLEELGITTVFKGLTGKLEQPQWGVPSKAGGIAGYIGFSTDQDKQEGPALGGYLLNYLSLKQVGLVFNRQSRYVPAEYKPRVKALRQFIERKMREAMRNLPIKPNADLRLQDMTGFRLQLENLAGADLRGATLNEAHLDEATLTGASLDEAWLRSTSLISTNLQEASLRNADLDGADLRWARLNNADLRQANLGGVKLTWANLRHADLSGAYLYGADLGYADLRGADLTGADLTEADLTGAEWDDHTVWPRGFRLEEIAERD